MVLSHPSSSLSVGKAGRNNLSKLKTPFLHTGMGERYIQSWLQYPSWADVSSTYKRNAYYSVRALYQSLLCVLIGAEHAESFRRFTINPADPIWITGQLAMWPAHIDSFSGWHKFESPPIGALPS